MKMKTHTHALLLLLFLSPLLLPFAAAQKPSDAASTSTDGDYMLDNSTSSVSPTTALIVIVIVLAFLITGCVSIYIQQCGDSSVPVGTPVDIPVAGRSRRVQIRGLEQSTIETFPTFMYSSVKELKIGKGSLECAVCLSEFEDDETLRLLPKCDHVFHTECIDTWLVGHTTCPVCRANLVPDPDQIGNPAESTHGVDSDGESEVSSPDAEVHITIPEEGTVTSGEMIPKRKLKLARSHSTGHSLIRPGEDCERFTLRLPAEIRRQLVVRAKLKRATSLVVLPRQSSSRRGYRGGEGSGSSRYGRIFGRSTGPSGRWSFAYFGSRVGSFRWPVRSGADGDVSVTAGSTGSKRATAVKPLEG